MRLTLSFALLTLTVCAQEPLPSADQVVARMVERDTQRQATLGGYTSTRRYVIDNLKHHKRAEMLVRMQSLDDGSKRFETISATGWGTARRHVFPKLLESEREASLPDIRDRSRISPQNYSFEMAGKDLVNGRAAYLIDILPKTQNKYLVQGRIWVDSEDYAIVRIEGKPAKNPSFWIKSVHFVHTYQRSGAFWFPSSDRSQTDARIIGATDLTIEYFDYAAAASTLSASRGSRP